jgi:uncharacterized protein YgiM (DUF1202 family)
MVVNHLILWIITIMVGFLVPRPSLAEAQHVEITRDRVNIRTGPTTSSQIVAKSRRGDVFEFRGREGKWYRIKMFSPACRYVHRSLAQKVSYTLSVPNQVSLRRNIFKAFLVAEIRAEKEADQKYPVEDRQGEPVSDHVQKNLELMWLLSDRYKLHVMHRFEVRSPIHDEILREGIEASW